ncbi:MAG: exosortase/archaeosortase family protein [Planctomycetota bacterium]|nr:exosortase/archaeosortase family protein [Planctomycetota bacterium]
MNEHTDQTGPKDGPRVSSLADLVTVSTPGASAHGIGLQSALKIGVLAGLLLALNFWQVQTLVEAWLKDANWSHGFIIPLFSLYLLFSRRDELFQAPKRVCLWGLPILVGSLLVMALAFYPVQNNWISQLSMTGMIFGLVLYLAGPQVAKLTWLPIFYLALGMPIPGSLYQRIAYPLQELAAMSSAFLLQLFGVSMEVTASHLDVTSITGVHHGLDVAEACSGVRSLMAFAALGVAMAYIEPRPMWQRIILVVAVLPITIACNILRVTLTATAFVVDKAEWGQHVMHTLMGMVLLVPALGMLLLLSWLMKSLFTEEEVEDDEDAGEAGPEVQAPRT